MNTRDLVRDAGSSLRLGQKARVQHDCGEGDALMVSRATHGLHYYCFRCHESGFIPLTKDLAESIAALNETQRLILNAELSEVQDIPLPHVHDVDSWPDDAKLWLYRYGVGRAEIAYYGIFYQPYYRRVVLPIKDGDAIRYWQARATVPGMTPKYIGAKCKPGNLLPLFDGGGDKLVLTEDILSAIKVNMAGLKSMPLLGTRISSCELNYILNSSLKTLIWTDNDPAGLNAKRKIAATLTAYDVPFGIVHSERDPKTYDRIAIRELTNEH